MSDHTGLYTQLRSIQKNRNLCRALHTGGYLAAIFCGFVWTPKAAVVLAAANLTVYIAVLRPVIKRLDNRFKAMVAQAGFENFLEDFSYAPASGLSAEEIEQSGLFNRQQMSGYLSRELITGTFRGLPFALADVSMFLKNPTPGPGKAAGRGIHVVGCWAVLRLEKEFPVSLRLTDRGFFDGRQPARGLPGGGPEAEILTGDDGVCTDFWIESDDGSAAAEFLAPWLLKRIEKLRNACPTPLLLSFSGDRLHVMLKGRFVAADAAIRQPANSQNTPVEQLPELEAVLELAEALGRA
jgi:hypothetical protein